MRRLSLHYTQGARDTIRRLPPLVKPCIKKLIEQLPEKPLAGKALRDDFVGYYRLRYQRWRIIYAVHEQSQRILIYLIEQRATVYETLKTIPPLELQEHRARYARRVAS